MQKIPQHIAIIMDGNGRWAENRGLSRVEGHMRGVDVVDDVVTAAKDLGVRYLTLYAFSDENWDRPEREVQALMNLFDQYLDLKKEKMIRDGVQFNTIGDITRLSPSIQRKIEEVRKVTSAGKGLTLTLAVSYGAYHEIARAVNQLIASGVSKVVPEMIAKALDTRDMPNPDLFIRTSGEMRISNFLLWQLAYTELYFTEVLWPDFNKRELEKAIEAYGERERRFGLTGEQVKKVGS